MFMKTKELTLSKKELIKKIKLYKRLIYRNTIFKTNSKDIDIQRIIKGLNIKNRKERITYVFDESCKMLDNQTKNINICGFDKNKQCIVQRNNKSNHICGCCRLCEYVTLNGCPSKNVACKLFNCSEVTKNYNTLKYKDLYLLKLLNFKQRQIIKSNYFTIREEALKDLYSYSIFYSFYRMIKRQFKRLFKKNKYLYLNK